MATNETTRRSKGKYETGRVAMTVAGQMPPNDKETEDAVLGALLIDSGAYNRVADQLKPAVFYNHENQLIYEAIDELGRQDLPIDMLSVSDLMEKKGTLEEVGGSYRIGLLGNSVSSSAHIKYHVGVIKDLYMSRQVISFCAEAESAAYERKIPVQEMLQTVEDGLFRLAIDGSKQEIYAMSDILRSVYEEIEAASMREGLSGVPSGFRYLDMLTGGWQKSNMIVLAARPAMGKTALVLSMAKNMLDQKRPVGIFSLEMSKEELVLRMLTNATQIPSNVLKSGKLTPIDWTVFNHQLGLLHQLPLYIDDSGLLSIYELATKARRMVRENHVEIIFIDYLQLMRAEGKAIGNREQEISTISRSIKQLAKELNIPIIALSQLNRGVESRVDKRPMLSDLRESGAIEQDADMVLLLHRPEYYGIMEDESGNSMAGLAELIVAKNRSGATANIRLRFQAELIKFSDLNSDDGRSLQALPRPEAPKPLEEEDLPDLDKPFNHKFRKDAAVDAETADAQSEDGEEVDFPIEKKDDKF